MVTLAHGEGGIALRDAATTVRPAVLLKVPEHTDGLCQVLPQVPEADPGRLLQLQVSAGTSKGQGHDSGVQLELVGLSWASIVVAQRDPGLAQDLVKVGVGEEDSFGEAGLGVVPEVIRGDRDGVIHVEKWGRRERLVARG